MKCAFGILKSISAEKISTDFKSNMKCQTAEHITELHSREPKHECPSSVWRNHTITAGLPWKPICLCFAPYFLIKRSDYSRTAQTHLSAVRASLTDSCQSWGVNSHLDTRRAPAQAESVRAAHSGQQRSEHRDTAAHTSSSLHLITHTHSTVSWASPDTTSEDRRMHVIHRCTDVHKAWII